MFCTTRDSRWHIDHWYNSTHMSIIVDLRWNKVCNVLHWIICNVWVRKILPPPPSRRQKEPHQLWFWDSNKYLWSPRQNRNPVERRSPSPQLKCPWVETIVVYKSFGCASCSQVCLISVHKKKKKKKNTLVSRILPILFIAAWQFQAGIGRKWKNIVHCICTNNKDILFFFCSGC